jgi:hypothetical protein
MGREEARSKDQSRHHKKLKSEGAKRLRTYSFIITSALIIILITASYIGSLPKVEHIPPDFKFSPQPWMSVVPSRIHYVGYIDFERAYAFSQNSSFFGSGGLVQLYQLNYTIYPQSVVYELDIQLLDVNTAVTVVKLQDDAQREFESGFAKAVKVPSWNYGQYIIRGLLMRTPDQQRPVLGYVSMANGYLVLSLDEKSGKQQVQRILDQMSYNAPSLFDNSTVRRGIYASGITDGSYAGLFLGMFGSQLSGSEMIVKSVTGGENTIVVTRSVLFPNEDLALNQYDEAHRVYRDALSYTILDSWLVITYQYTTNKLRSELTGI